MTAETILGIVGLIFTVVCWIGYRHCVENVYLK